MSRHNWVRTTGRVLDARIREIWHDRPDGTKAIFDEKDPRINVIAVAKAQEAADAERFRQQLNGT